MRFPDRYGFDFDGLRESPLTSESGAIVPLSAVAATSIAEGETELYPEDLRQEIPVTGRLTGRDLGSGIRDVQPALAAESWPIGYTWRLGGQYESQRSSFRSTLLVLSMAVLLVFGVLAAQVHRLVPPLITLSAVLLSLIGAFGLLLLAGTSLNVSSMMGPILLIGLMVKNGIILVDYVESAAARGADGEEALVEAGSARLRPILMTTRCTLSGLLPVAVGPGPGAETQKRLAIAVSGGPSVSTVATLIVVPAALSMVRGRKRCAASTASGRAAYHRQARVIPITGCARAHA
jgi:multidrug efflux pump subunit AcrB